MNQSYKKAGVDIEAGNETVERIKYHAKRTFRPEVISGIGGFAGLFELQHRYKNPVLVSGADGVGTKLKIAFTMERHDTIGIDLVAMCVNDILVQGAEPLFFLDYLATAKLEPKKAEEIIKGISIGCLEAGCALLGGETAEMPGMYQQEEYDLAGFAVGVVEKDKIIDGSKIEEGDVIIGFASNGLHSNGFSLVRYLFFEQYHFHLDEMISELGCSLGDELLKPTRIYVQSVLQIMKQVQIKGMAHITGGGLLENVPRVLPAGLQANLQLKSWPILPIFTLLQKLGELDHQESFRTFNMGIGFVLIIDQKDKEKVLDLAKQYGETAYVIGEITKGDQGVVLLEEGR
ncbi:phosphoribosylformylglycinamidine cyclo-ligase [Tepidibacillus sp. HK-1]|uniref:phosphoribosylformylglycinamidine cyclo-ligase n=1 Tax=Tepidibacillus sp. HK-1 TaxID=1883407 RepID=UPI00085397B4|nr:phosphoribosylformylglycinamidine cyclo-ligase [Tepidibacillus sp. HK-1]GBF10800.1 phosphoribosylformylglycinamidine cyclo-ligase [Tepidibacillus sp. HK-1]